MTATARRTLLLVLGLLAVGATLRVAALQGYDRIPHGDVNLHALAARNFAETGRLHYPMKFDFGPNLSYESLTSPAVLHPRGSPFLAGLLARKTDLEAYDALRALSLAASIGLIVLAAALALRARAANERGWTTALALLAGSPLLFDYAGCGSPYSALTLCMALGGLWLGFGPRAWWGFGATAGALSALAFEFHGGGGVALLVATLVVLLAHRRAVGLRALVGFVLAFAALRAPSLLWSWSEVGSPLSPLSNLLQAYRFNLVTPVATEERVVLHALPGAEIPWRAVLLRMPACAVQAARGILVEAGPPALLLAGAGLACLRGNRRFRAALLPSVLFLAVVVAWGSFEQRFLVVLLPPTLVLAGVGFGFLLTHSRVLAWTLLGGALLWNAFEFARGPNQRYYASHVEQQYLAGYPMVREVAEIFGAQPEFGPGVVLGFDPSGLGALYWHRRPYVHAPWANAELATRLARDFDVRWVWTTRARADEWRRALPDGRIALTNDVYAVLELRRDD